MYFDLSYFTVWLWFQKPELRWFQNVWVRRLQRCVAHRVFGYFGNLVATANVIVIAVCVFIRKKLTNLVYRYCNSSMSY